jgi:hypothetical protein
MEVLTLSQSLPEKLQMNNEKNVLIQGLPSTIEKQFIKIAFAKNVTPLLRTRKIDFAMIFAISQRQLKDILNDVLPALNANPKLWIAYPKPASKIASDLTRVCNWDCVESYGFENTSMIGIDHVWNAVSFKRVSKAASKIKISAKEIAVEV